MIRFSVPGLPAPQGSKTRWGTEDNPRTRPWREAVSWHAQEAMNGQELLTGPVWLRVTFTFPRPKSHYGSGRNTDRLKPSAPEYVARTPDLDKLLRAVGDACSGICFRDDAQIASLSAAKCYGNPGCLVELRELVFEEAP